MPIGDRGNQHRVYNSDHTLYYWLRYIFTSTWEILSEYLVLQFHNVSQDGTHQLENQIPTKVSGSLMTTLRPLIVNYMFQIHMPISTIITSFIASILYKISIKIVMHNEPPACISHRV